MVDIKTCNECNTERPLTEFHKSAQARDGHRSKCKPCVKAYNAARYAENRDEVLAQQAAYNRTPEGRETQMRGSARHRAKHPEREQARSAVNNALAAGTKRKPKHCCSCGSQHKGPIEAHHWKGYEEEFWLDILWLCKPCHSVRE